MMIIAIFMFAQTTVPAGPVQGSWDVTGSPYLVTGNINVPNNASLSIGPGVEVIFAGTFKLDVLGQIVCNGNEENRIVFTAQDTLSGWQSIRFTNNSISNPASSFSYTDFTYGRAINGTSPTDPMNCGGAIWADNAGTLSFDHCSFRRCKSMGDGSTIYAVNGTNINFLNSAIKSCETEWFGAICIENGALNVQNAEFVNNTSNVFGAAFYILECTQANIISSVFINNAAGAVAGIYSLYSPLVIKNSLFMGNITDTGRGGAIGVTHGTTTITNCTFTGNSSPMDGGAIWFNILDAPPVITNSIFWDNLPDAISTVTTTYSLSYCSMQVPQGGATNIWGNPLFTNPPNWDFSLQASSPCIDAGTPNAEGLGLPLLDLGGNPRIIDGNMDSIDRIDIGCYERQVAAATGDISGQVTDIQGLPIPNATITVDSFSTVTNDWGLYSITLDEGTYSVTCSKPDYSTITHENVVVSSGQTTIVNFCLDSVSNADLTEIGEQLGFAGYPNPFTESMAFELSLPLTGSLMIEVYNLKGQKVRTLHDGLLVAGKHRLSWDGCDDHNVPLGRGVYLCKMNYGNRIRTARIVKM